MRAFLCWVARWITPGVVSNRHPNCVPMSFHRASTCGDSYPMQIIAVPTRWPSAPSWVCRHTRCRMPSHTLKLWAQCDTPSLFLHVCHPCVLTLDRIVKEQVVGFTCYHRTLGYAPPRRAITDSTTTSTYGAVANAPVHTLGALANDRPPEVGPTGRGAPPWPYQALTPQGQKIPHTHLVHTKIKKSCTLRIHTSLTGVTRASRNR